jgi:DNA-binding PadR family transcriptional regulator
LTHIQCGYIHIGQYFFKGAAMSSNNIDDALPLKPAVFHILLVLANADHHGLGIADEVEAATAGAIRLGPGTLYRSLKEMTRDGLLREVPPPCEDEDPRRKFYRITENGRAVLLAEASRYQQIVEVAKQRAVLREAQ